MASSSDSDAATGKQAEKKPSWLRTAWEKLALDKKTVLMMFKGSVAPTIAIAMYQSDAVAAQYQTLGYLIAIMALLGFSIMPRGVFIQTMSLNLIATGLGAAVNLLALYCSTQARLHTTPTGIPITAYNSSASAVCAIWLVVQIYLVNYLRAARPQFQFPAIVYSIFCMVSMSYGPTFPTMAYTLSFMTRLLEAFLTGFALAIAVHFLVFPVSSRKVVCAELSGYLMSVSGVLKAQAAFVEHLETADPIAQRQKAEEEEAKKKHHKKKKAGVDGASASPQSVALRKAVDSVIALHAKINGDVVTAHREFAIGKLQQKDISTFWKKSRTMLTPLMGLISVLDHLKQFFNENQFSSTDLPPEEMQRNREMMENLRTTARTMHEPLETMTQTLTAGLMHVNIAMEFIKAPKTKPEDAEEGKVTDAPGSATFIASYKQKLDAFEASKQVTLIEWCKQKGIPNPEDFLKEISIHALGDLRETKLEDQFQRQLFLMIYLEYLLLRLGQIILEMILYVDQLKQDGKFKRNRFLYPGQKTVRKWFWAIFSKEDMTREEHFMSDMEVGASQGVDLGKSFGHKKDPEHLPPQNWRERIGDTIRYCPRFFRSEYSSFAFRTACATMSIAITAYLEATQQFFLQQRLVWALIMVAISMSQTAGQSAFNFILRILGTVVAMIAAYVIWYIVDGRTPGVIVFLWFWIFCGFYVVLKFPKIIIVGVLGVVTTILIVGYELQTQKIGITASESNGQPAYPTYVLAPYRLACVAGGLLVAWIWTIWPYPVSENSELRKDVAATLYLLANFYSNVHETVVSRARGTAGDINQKGSHAYLLDKAKVKVLSKILALLSHMQMNAGFAKFQLTMGGKFPMDEYQAMIECLRRIMVATALIAHASDSLSQTASHQAEQSDWFKDFKKIAQSIGNTSHSITSTLALLSSSLASGQPLPPFMNDPKPFEFVARLEAIDKTILSVQHISEPEYSAFVVIQLCSESLNRNISTMKKHVTNLVGEIDFSFRPMASSTSTSLTLTDSKSDDLKEQ